MELRYFDVPLNTSGPWLKTPELMWAPTQKQHWKTWKNFDWDQLLSTVTSPRIKRTMIQSSRTSLTRRKIQGLMSLWMVRTTHQRPLRCQRMRARGAREPVQFLGWSLWWSQDSKDFVKIENVHQGGGTVRLRQRFQCAPHLLKVVNQQYLKSMIHQSEEVKNHHRRRQESMSQMKLLMVDLQS